MYERAYRSAAIAFGCVFMSHTCSTTLWWYFSIWKLYMYIETRINCRRLSHIHLLGYSVLSNREAHHQCANTLCLCILHRGFVHIYKYIYLVFWCFKCFYSTDVWSCVHACCQYANIYTEERIWTYLKKIFSIHLGCTFWCFNVIYEFSNALCVCVCVRDWWTATVCMLCLFSNTPQI